MHTSVLDIVSAVFVSSGLFSALVVLLDLRGRPQPMKIMNSVWVLTALWGGFLALWAYYGFARAARRPSGPQTAPGSAPTGSMHAGLMSSEPMQTSGMQPMKPGSEDLLPVISESMDPDSTGSGSMPMSSGMSGMGMRGDRGGVAISGLPATPANPEMPAMSGMSEGPKSPEMSGLPEHPNGPGALVSGMSMKGAKSSEAIPQMPAMSEMSAEISPMPAPVGGMPMGRPRPFWQSALLSSLHCGAGCTLADLIGEWFVFWVPVAIGGSLLAGAWALDYALALLIGVGFQYAAIQAMGRLPRKVAVVRAVQADFFSLTAWQIGMYGWMALAIFGFFGGVAPRHDRWTFWFMMQLAMLSGLAVAYPVNRLLIGHGIKKAM